MNRTELFALIEAARRSPDARRVLHDVLLERYPSNYGWVVEQASQWANHFYEPYFILLDSRALRRFEAGAQNPPAHLSDAFLLRHADDVRMRNLHMGLITLGVILPNDQPFDRRRWRRRASYREPHGLARQNRR